MRKTKVEDLFTSEIESLSIHLNGDSYLLRGKLINRKNGELWEVTRVELDSRNSKEIAEIIEEFIIILNGDN